MGRIDPITAIEPDGTEWPLHAAIAKAVGGKVMPFDKYQGPYIVVGEDEVMGQRPYAVPVQGLGIVRLWMWETDYEFYIWREDIEITVGPFFSEGELIEAALDLVKRS